MSTFRTKLQKGDVLYSVLGTAGAGFLIGVSFFVGELWFMSVAGVACFLFIIHQTRSARHAFFSGWTAGFVFYGMVFGELAWSLFPFDWYGIAHPLAQLAFVAGTWLGASVVMGSVWGFFALCARLLKTDSFFDALIFPSLWVLGEFVSSWVYYVYMLGPGSFFGPHFTFGYLGYVASEDYALLQLASLGGVYLLSFVLVCAAALLTCAYEGKRWCGHLLGAGVLVWVLFSSVFLFMPAESHFSSAPLSLAVVSRYLLPTSEQDDAFEAERYAELMNVLLGLRDLDMIVLPENASFFRLLLQNENISDVEKLKETGRSASGPVIIDSGDAVVNGIFTSQVMYFDARKRSFGEKQFLLPFGEYIPYLYQWALRITGNEDILRYAVSMRNYMPGDEVALSDVNGISVAVRFCDEAMSPVLFRTQVDKGAQVLVNISSLGWFNGSHFMASHMERVARVRAVELHRYFIQSGNVAPAFIVNERGVVEAKTSGKNIEALTADVYGFSNRTFYSLFPFAVAIVSAALILFGSVRKFCIVYKKRPVSDRSVL